MPGDLLPKNVQDKLAAGFVEAVQSVANENDIPLDAVDISIHELNLALAECQKDLRALLARRGGVDPAGFHGLSLGKVAGVLVFRLSRYRTVHVLADKLPVNKRVRLIATKLLELATLRFACESILKIHPDPWHPEITYIIARRHTNQEMLGSAFDVLSHYCTRLRTVKPLDESPYSRLF